MDEDRGWRFWLAISITAIATLFTGLGFWVALHHEAEHRAAVMTEVSIILIAVAAFGLTAWAVYLNLTDARRAKSLHAQIMTIKEEYATQVAGLNKHHKAELAKRLEELGSEHVQ